MTFAPSTLSATAAQYDPVAFFDAVLHAYRHAEDAVGGSLDRFYAIGGLPVRLRFAGSALLPYLVPALAHLTIEPVSKPSLTVCLWDSTSTRTQMPPPAWGAEDYYAGGEIRGFTGQRIQAVFQLGASILSLFDSERNLAIYWVKTAEQIPYYESGAPLRVIFQMWASRQGLQLVHAGAVGFAQGGVLLVGKGGSGKSSTALACLQSALLYASDDFCLVKPDSELRVFSLYSTGKTHAQDIPKFPFLVPMISNAERLGTEKALYFLNSALPEKLARGFPIRALLAPHVTQARETTLKPASAVALLSALVPSTVILAPSAMREIFQTLADMVRQVPCYYLELGSDRSQIPQAIIRLLSEAMLDAG